jgi:hypothetical protein
MMMIMMIMMMMIMMIMMMIPTHIHVYNIHVMCIFVDHV